MQTVPGKRTALLTVSLVLSACGGGGGGGGGTVPPATTIPTFTTWSNVGPGSAVKINGSGQQVSGTWDGTKFTRVERTAAESEGYSATLTFDQNRELTRLLVLTPDSKSVVLDKTAGDTFTNLTLAPGSTPQFVGAVSPTATGGTGNVAIMANPINLGWEYQTFGVWESAGTDGRTFGAMSVGAPTAGTAIPGGGTATFTGYATGSYISAVTGKGSTALAELTVGVNFGTQTLTFNTTNTRTSTDWATFTAASELDLTGILTYVAGTNSFTGKVDSISSTNALTGDSTGQFYGPDAQELGGVFFLKGAGVETYAGAYGAAKQ